MANNETRRKERRKYLRLRNNHSWFSTLLFFIISCATLLVTAVFAAVFTLLIVSGGMEQEYHSKQLLAQLYEDGVAAQDDPYQIFDMAQMDYQIKDQSGSVLHSHGEITYADEPGYFELASAGRQISYDADGALSRDSRLIIYPDTRSKVLSLDEDHELSLDFTLLLKECRNLVEQEMQVTSDTGEVTFLKMIELPIWETIEMKHGTETLIFKASILISPSNVLLVIAMLAVLTTLIIIVFAALVLHAVTSGLNQRRINKLFFTDLKIKGNNWLWFLFHAEHKLRSPWNTKKSFALINLEFADYRHFCVCHSLDEGDAMLCAIYQSLTRLIGKRELCARSTENSFALLLNDPGETALRERLQGILAELGTINTDHSFRFHVGVYPIPAADQKGLTIRRKDVDIETDYNNACAACVSLDANAGTEIVFYNEKLIEEQRWVDTVQELQQRALDNEEFIVYYQPKYDPRTHELRGAEALIRWQSPEHGFLSPYRFIPIFEKNGFITQIDHYMLSHVAKAQRQWLDEGQKCVPISVNVSRAHFIESDLAEQIRDIVDREQVPHALIEIELTESAFFDDKNAMIETIVKLKQFGFTVSMDDFGSGYSSLNSLKDMPLDVLKLDADFFRGAAADTDRGEIIISETIKLAKSLHMRTVAEGVEVKDQVEFLAAQGCDMIQGYYFAKPMPAEDYRERMIQGKNDGAEAQDQTA